MDTKDEKIMKRVIGTTLKEVIEIVRGRSVGEIKVESGDLKIAIRLPVAQGVLKSSEAAFRAEDGESSTAITSHLVGIFHRASTPFESPLVEKGQAIFQGQVVGYIESMRLMHEVLSTKSGKVKEIIVDENACVDYGQRLILIDVSS
ncbi:MAG: acetyl-CoA carboxylase biotin carboxyl carrier protein [Candidatus Xenobiia bacterium LiM19]